MIYPFLYGWAKFRRTKGAIKLHLILDHDGYLPSFAVITEGKVSDVKVAHTLKFDPGTIVVYDRVYGGPPPYIVIVETEKAW